MEHATCQAAVLDDETARPDVRRHLARCDECRRFADEVARIVSVAPTLYPHGGPDGLADRVVAAVAADSLNAEAAHGGLSVQSSARRGLWGEVRGPLVRSTAVAAVLLLLLGVLAVARIDDEPTGDERVLLAAATATEESGSAEVEVEGSVSVAVPRPSDGAAAADFRGLPRAMEAYFEAQWTQMIEAFNAQLAEFERQVNRTMEEFNRQMEEFQRQLRSGQPGRRPTPPTAPTRPTLPGGAAAQRPTLPESLDLSFSISGRGALSFAGKGALGIEGQVATAGGTIGPSSASAGFRLAARGDELALRAPDGSWRDLPRATGPLGAVVLQPDAVPRILRAATDVERIGGGHYRFRVEDDRAGGPFTGEVEIGDDKRVRRLSVSSGGLVEDQQWDTTLVLRLGGYGSARVDAAAPAPTGAVDLGGEADAVIYPFGPQISATLNRP